MTAAFLLTRALLVVALTSGLAVAEDEPSHRHQNIDEGATGHENDLTVHLSAAQLAAFGVTLATASPARIDHGVELLGEVRPNGDTLAHIVPRFPGIVRQVRTTVGDEVRAGEVLATVESNESLAPYELKTQLDGTVIERHITRGESVDREKPVFVIADLSSVWVDLAVYQKDLDHVRVGQSVLVSSGSAETEGKISYIAPVVDGPTRTAIARVVLPNAAHTWRPGLFVTARVLDPIPAAVAVARGAIQTIEGRTTVFVEAGEGFEPRTVTLGRGGETLVEVLDGLRPGDRYVATNSFLLKAELGKGEAGHAH
ncbi:MAG: efflux RND transporter periplasmic adaptor subunit [Candidatus Binatia bacterium]